MMFKSHDERRSGRRILGIGNVLDCWNDGFERRNAGLAASVAISIRPKLLPLAAVLAGWTMFARPRRRLAVFALATLPGCVAVAAINSHLFGSPLTSGYGDLSSLFATENIDDTISSYFRWLVESQTPFVFAGIGILAIAPSGGHRTAARIHG
jgi:hypothetical protein